MAEVQLEALRLDTLDLEQQLLLLIHAKIHEEMGSLWEQDH